MLEFVRQNLMGKVALALLTLIALSFVFVGLNYTTNVSTFAAKVDGETISASALELRYRQQIEINPQIAGAPAELRQEYRRQLLEQLVQEQVIENYLDDAGYTITTSELTRAVHATPDFQVDGVFDEATYREALAVGGRTVAEYEEAMLRQLRLDQLVRAIRGSAIVTPADYRKFLNLRFEQRIVTTASIDAAAVADDVSVTDDMVAAYYEENASLFQLEETADIEYVEVVRSDVAAGVEVSEQELREHYEFNKDAYQQDEQREARHILIPNGDDEEAAEALANEVMARIGAGESFNALLAEFPDGGELGRATRSQLDDALGGAIFSMEEGEIDGPVRSDFGFHIVRLDKVFESGPLPFEDVRASILTDLQDQRAESLFMDRVRDVEYSLFDATDLRALAETTGLDVKAIAGFSRQGGEPFGTSQAVIDAVFAPAVLSGERLSDLVEIDADRAIVLAVTAHQEARTRPLEEVREQVVASLEREQTNELMAARAAEMEQAVSAGEDFATAAAAVGATVNDAMVVGRETTQADQFLMASVFAAPKPADGKITAGSTRNGVGGYTVYRVDAVMPGRPETVPVEQRDQGKLEIADSYGIGELVAFVQALRESADVVIDDDVVAATDMFQ